MMSITPLAVHLSDMHYSWIDWPILCMHATKKVQLMECSACIPCLLHTLPGNDSGSLRPAVRVGMVGA